MIGLPRRTYDQHPRLVNVKAVDTDASRRDAIADIPPSRGTGVAA